MRNRLLTALSAGLLTLGLTACPAGEQDVEDPLEEEDPVEDTEDGAGAEEEDDM